jgi:hypothetical protein
MAYFRKFASKSPYADMFSIGTSPQGRSIECLVVAGGREFTPAKAKKSGKAVILIQNGIHSGEIEGKDASMLLLRDILVTGKLSHLLTNLILLVIPILNVDGHERVSGWNRPNQNGPEEMGWRTNSHNLNLNRDFMKADSAEVQAFLRLFSAWQPDFFIDNHTTNGADYQYHITYALEKTISIDDSLGKWGQSAFLPAMLDKVESDGFLTAPYIQFKNEKIESGIIDTPALPRLSTGYTAAQNRLGLLVETHSLKPYENRVNSTYSMNSAALSVLHSNWKALKTLNIATDRRASTLKNLPLRYTLAEQSKPFEFKGFQSETYISSITGSGVVSYSEIPEVKTIPIYDEAEISVAVSVPKGYIIPKEYSHLVKVMELHGIVVEKALPAVSVQVEAYTFTEHQFSPKPYEGRQCVNVRCSSEMRRVSVNSGDFLVRTNQRTNRVIVHLLEPEGPDSFVSWGFFNAFFERKEYAEAYVMEPIARQMLEADHLLREEFLALLDDEEFRNDPAARLDFFYRRSPYFDIREKQYPIYRLL